LYGVISGRALSSHAQFGMPVRGASFRRTTITNLAARASRHRLSKTHRCSRGRLALASQQGAWANIPPKRNRKDAICFSPYLYRARNLVERFFNKIKQCRRIATRYDKLAANYLAFIKLASIRISLRANESTP
jgi:hypothetical protein